MPGIKKALIVWTTVLLFICSSAYAKVIIVKPDVMTLQQAIDMASDGDTILVSRGRYTGNIVINKTITLKGEHWPSIVANKGNIVEIKAPGVKIEGFILTYSSKDSHGLEDTAIYVRKGANDAVIQNNRFKEVLFGIWNVEGNNLTIKDNVIKGIKELEIEKRGNCINLTSSQHVKIINNRLDYCRDGIYMELSHNATVVGNEISHARYAVHTMWVDRCRFIKNTVHDSIVGMAIMYTDYGEVKDNFAYGNSTHGILLLQAVKSKIIGNISIANTKGMFIYNSVYNTIESNLIMNNQLGIHNWGGSEDNIIKGNSIIDNEIQVKFVAAKSQTWNGNYWSDYLGWDMQGDGYGDTPYEANTLVDQLFWRYPLVKLFYTSPALHLLWLLDKEFPIFDVPTVVDNSPSMEPFHPQWKELKAKLALYKPQRYYGEIKKLPHLPTGGF